MPHAGLATTARPLTPHQRAVLRALRQGATITRYIATRGHTLNAPHLCVPGEPPQTLTLPTLRALLPYLAERAAAPRDPAAPSSPGTLRCWSTRAR